MSTAITTSAQPEQPDLANGEALYEIIDGQRAEKHVSKVATYVGSIVGWHLNNYGIPRKLGAGVVEGLVRLQKGGQQRRPDVMFIPFNRWTEDRLTDEEPWELVPTLMVEIVSPTNGFSEILDKVDEYFAGGVPLVWVLHPSKQRVWVFTSPTQISVVTGNGLLEGGSILPEFCVSLSELFGPTTRPSS